MALTVRGQVGPQVLADGTEQPFRTGKTGELVVTELHGKYFEQSMRGNLFHASIAAAGAALSVAGTAAGIALYNPAGGAGAKLLSIIKVTLGIVSGTYVVGSIMHGVNTNVNAAATTGTALTAVPGLVGSSAKPVGQPFSAATLPVAQSPLRPFALKNATPPFTQLFDDVDGEIVLAPGTTWSLFVIGADTTPLELVGITWEEVAA